MLKRFGIIVWLFTCMAFGAIDIRAEGFSESKYQTGDIVFQTSLSPQSQAIQIATHSQYSHVGLIVMRKGKPWVFEAIQPVQYTLLNQWIRRGKNRVCVIKRLMKPKPMGDAVADGRFDRVCRKYQGKDYDPYFGWSDERIYCSELVWKVYKEAAGVVLAPLQKMREFNLADPRVKKVLAKRYGDKVPLEELVISPIAIFDSKLLRLVNTQ